MRNKVVLVLLDACRADYISLENTPFLADIALKGRYYSQLVPGYGFCERTEILVGKEPLESDYFTAIGRSRLRSPYRNQITLFSILGKLEEIINLEIFSKVLRRLLWAVLKNLRGSFFPLNIPLKDLPNLCLTEDGTDSLIEHSQNSLYFLSKPVYFDSTTSLNHQEKGTDESRLNSVIKNLAGPFNFFPIYVSALDKVGHEFGPNSDEVKIELLKLDHQLKNFYGQVISMNPSATIIFCGDHGMSEVKKKVDISNIVTLLQDKGELSRDLEIFLDSTLARFWFNDNNISEKNTLKKFLETSLEDVGLFIDRREYASYGIPDSDLYGDCMWICNDGVLIAPDYFNSNKSIKGMHGYRPEGIQHNGFAILLSKKILPKKFDLPLPLTTIYHDIRSDLVN